MAHLKYKKLEWSLSKYSGTSVWRKTFFALVMVKYRQKKQEIKPRLFDISRFTVFERNSGEGRRSEVSLKEMNVNIYIYLLGYWADLATDRERQLTTARANQSNGLTNGRATNWAPEVKFGRFRALSRRQMTFPFCC